MNVTVPRYVCVDPRYRGTLLSVGEAGLSCGDGQENGCFIPFAVGTKTPVFCRQQEEINEYSLPNAAEVHDNALRWLFSTFQVEEDDVRRRLVRRLCLEPGSRVLITGAGAGNDIPYFVEALDGKGELYAQDIAKEMLLWGEQRIRQKYEQCDVSLFFSVCDAMDLPFEDGMFDAAYHFGGANLFKDIGKGIAEMNRVVRSGGRVLLGDEGVAPWLRQMEISEILINNTHLYGFQPPLDKLPVTANDVALSWELGNCFWVITFTVGEAPPSIDIDVPHVGRRGGSMRTRYYGRIEGIDPALRDAIYKRAEKLGVSRVELIESMLRGGLHNEHGVKDA